MAASSGEALRDDLGAATSSTVCAATTATVAPSTAKLGPRAFVGYAPRGHALASAPEADEASEMHASTSFDPALYPSLTMDDPMDEVDDQPSDHGAVPNGVMYRPSGHAKGEAAARSEGPKEMVYLPENYPSLFSSTVAARERRLYTPSGHAVPPLCADEAEPSQTEAAKGEQPLGVATVEVRILPSSGRVTADSRGQLWRAASATASTLRRRAGKALGRARGAITRKWRPTRQQSEKHQDSVMDGVAG